MNIHSFHKKNGKFYDSIRIYTYSNVALEYYWRTFYNDKKKVVPRNISEILIEPLSLAVWFMDDGYKRNDCNALRLNMDSFTKREQELLRDTLKVNFDIDSTLHKKGKFWNIYIPQRSAKKFVKIVEPFVIPSFQYKIALTP